MRPRQVHASLLEHVETIGVTNFLHEATELGRTFQLDAARVTIGSRALTSPDRLVAVAAPGGKFKDSFELLLLWLIYLSAVGQASSPGAAT